MTKVNTVFKEWDRVYVDYPPYGVKNEKGTVLGPLEDNNNHPVRLDKADPIDRHDCLGKCHKDHGLYINTNQMRLLSNKE